MYFQPRNSKLSQLSKLSLFGSYFKDFLSFQIAVILYPWSLADIPELPLLIMCLCKRVYVHRRLHERKGDGIVIKGTRLESGEDVTIVHHKVCSPSQSSS